MIYLPHLHDHRHHHGCRHHNHRHHHHHHQQHVHHRNHNSHPERRYHHYCYTISIFIIRRSRSSSNDDIQVSDTKSFQGLAPRWSSKAVRASELPCVERCYPGRFRVAGGGILCPSQGLRRPRLPLQKGRRKMRLQAPVHADMQPTTTTTNPTSPEEI